MDSTSIYNGVRYVQRRLDQVVQCTFRSPWLFVCREDGTPVGPFFATDDHLKLAVDRGELDRYKMKGLGRGRAIEC